MSAQQPYEPGGWQPDTGAEEKPLRRHGDSSFQPATFDGVEMMPAEIIDPASVAEIVAGLQLPQDTEGFKQALGRLNKSSNAVHEEIVNLLIKNPPKNEEPVLTEAQALEHLQSDDPAKRILACEFFREHPLSPAKK